MKDAADVTLKLLHPHGHAFIFCAFQQAIEWRLVLASAGGGSFFNVPAVPDLIIRDSTAIHSAEIFLYRANAYELACHVYKYKAGSSQSEYQMTVGFENASIELCSGTTLPLYSNVVDHYIPPKGPEQIQSNGRP
jgi:hypothetical protein